MGGSRCSLSSEKFKTYDKKTFAFRPSTKRMAQSPIFQIKSPLSYSSGGCPTALNAIPLHSTTSTFCPIGKFCKVTTFSGIVQGKFLVCRTTDNRLRTTDFWAVADCSLLSVDCSHQKKRKFDVVSPASPLYITYPPYRGDTDVIYLGVGRP